MCLLMALCPRCARVQVECKPVADPGTTGNFEVTLNKVLVHSKKTMGHGAQSFRSTRALTRSQCQATVVPAGKCTSAEETNRVIVAVAVTSTISCAVLPGCHWTACYSVVQLLSPAAVFKISETGTPCKCYRRRQESLGQEVKVGA